ncbi:MAG: hypothetical protein OEW75_19020, partial [Cyclobacteriaceae bacterium]|nr:hypothetical protein [Cyclobacteriaceae bacterium]
MNIKYSYLFVAIFMLTAWSCTQKKDETIGETEITKWRDNKKAAASITYDDGTINQFTVALPIM